MSTLLMSFLGAAVTPTKTKREQNNQNTLCIKVYLLSESLFLSFPPVLYFNEKSLKSFLTAQFKHQRQRQSEVCDESKG